MVVPSPSSPLPLLPQQNAWPALTAHEWKPPASTVTPLVAVAVNVSGLPLAPIWRAVTVFVPRVEPSVQLPSAATPLPSVLTLTGPAVPTPPPGAVIEPPPDPTAKVIGRPPTAPPW